MGIPLGIKPNHNLSQFIGCAVLDAMNAWEHVTTGLNEMQDYILWSLSFSSLLGVTVLLAVAQDFFLMCSVHVFMPYSVVAFIYRHILRMLGTLINMFNGKKYNIMRQRVDSNKFTILEFYIGVLMVALIIFLFPTLAIYYFADFVVLVLTVMII